MGGHLPSKGHVNFHQFTALFSVACKLPRAVANLKVHVNLQGRILTKIPLFIQCTMTAFHLQVDVMGVIKHRELPLSSQEGKP